MDHAELKRTAISAAQDQANASLDDLVRWAADRYVRPCPESAICDLTASLGRSELDRIGALGLLATALARLAREHGKAA